MADIWSGKFIRVAPSSVKHLIGTKAPQFQGFNQQDSQELMSFLMDGLHEDLNRVQRKPVVEDVESDGRADAVVADLSWKAYKQRNDSVVADLCCGLMKSHVKCNVCDRETTKFDPSLSVSVPLPVANDRFFIVRGTVVVADPFVSGFFSLRKSPRRLRLLLLFVCPHVVS